MNLLYPAFGAGWIICLSLLAIFHLLWKDAHRSVRYMLGAGAICTGCSVAGAVLSDPVIAFGPWCVTSAGLFIALWTWIEERAEKRLANAQKNGELIGMTRGLTQDLIDAGGTERGSDQASRRN